MIMKKEDASLYGLLPCAEGGLITTEGNSWSYAVESYPSARSVEAYLVMAWKEKKVKLLL